MRARSCFSLPVVLLSLAAAGLAAGCSSGAGGSDEPPLGPDSGDTSDGATQDGGPTSDGATHDATVDGDAASRDGSPPDHDADADIDAADSGARAGEDSGADGGPSDSGPLDAGSDSAPDADRSDSSDGSLGIDSGADAEGSSVTDSGVDASSAPDANGPPDSGEDAGPLGPCSLMPIYAADGGTALPSRAWCDSLGYPTYTQAIRSTAVHISAGFSGDGGVTLLGAVGEDTLTYSITVAGTVIPGNSPFAIALDPEGAIMNASALDDGMLPDAGGKPTIIAWAGAVGTGGDLALGGVGFGSDWPIYGTLWTYAANGSVEAADFLASPSNYEDAQVGSIAPIAGGDFIVAGTFTSETVFGTTSLASAGTYDTFVGRFSPGGQVRWVSAVGESSPGPNGPIDVVVDADGHVSLVTMGVEGDGGYEGLAARFDAATGAKQWVTSIESGFPYAETIAPDGDDVVVMLSTAYGYQALGLHGADGSPRYQGPVVGVGTDYPSQVDAMVSDGAGGTVVTGTTYGGTFGSISIPSSLIGQCFLAGSDASGNPTWLTLCSPLQYSTGLDLIVSGKKVVLTGAAGFAPTSGVQLFTFAEEYVLP